MSREYVQKIMQRFDPPAIYGGSNLLLNFATYLWDTTEVVSKTGIVRSGSAGIFFVNEGRKK
jgi:hypothetical protein